MKDEKENRATGKKADASIELTAALAQDKPGHQG
jgi:hypothetical protein